MNDLRVFDQEAEEADGEQLNLEKYDDDEMTETNNQQ